MMLSRELSVHTHPCSAPNRDAEWQVQTNGCYSRKRLVDGSSAWYVLETAHLSIGLDAVLQRFVENLPVVAVSAPAGAMLGYASARLLDRVRASDSRKDAAKRLVLAVEPVLRELRAKRFSFSEAMRSGAPAVSLYFKNAEPDLIGVPAEQLRAVAKDAIRLSHQCLEHWSNASKQLEQLELQHASLVNTRRLSGRLADLSTRGVVYLSDLDSALAGLTSALRATSREASRETRQVIRRHIEE